MSQTYERVQTSFILLTYISQLYEQALLTSDVTSQQNLRSDDRRHKIHIKHYS